MNPRREFLKTAALAGAALTIDGTRADAVPQPGPRQAAAAAAPFAAPPLETVRVGFVGVGHQGTSHVENFLRIPGVDITAICDVQPPHAERARQRVRAAGRPAPAVYTGGLDDYKRMIDEAPVDLVFVATHWDYHAPVMLYGMRAGKHVATEVPLAVTLDECWELVETAERTRRHCVMMENCCYDRTEMMILAMVRRGLFGELLHAEGGYLHDLRELKLTDFYYDRWRLKHSVARNGDLYPTHGLGPIAQWLDINRGNQFDYLVTMGSPSRGLREWAAEHIGPGSVEATQTYALSDVVNTLIKTRRGATILLTHDTNLPRPYSRKILLQGTRGLVRKYPEQKIHVEGRSPAHRWEDLEAYRAEFEHPVWRALEEASRGAGHGGMDYIEDYRLVAALREGTPTDIDVYDGAAWTAITMLSERSIANRSAAQDVPDFTRGAWQTRPALDLGERRPA
ncbi:MAG: Gfo/Idh/MocA family oxidoreductase [Vicinamibacteraceae bacterium]|nr:Gfo/Idh/MocA family oxidoreductase [Vicinamibacteraceae bacterium]